jgi:hypothetical protein
MSRPFCECVDPAFAFARTQGGEESSFDAWGIVQFLFLRDQQGGMRGALSDRSESKGGGHIGVRLRAALTLHHVQLS